MTMTVAVCICTLARPAGLERCLQAIAAPRSALSQSPSSSSSWTTAPTLGPSQSAAITAFLDYRSCTMWRS